MTGIFYRLAKSPAAAAAVALLIATGVLWWAPPPVGDITMMAALTLVFGRAIQLAAAARRR